MNTSVIEACTTYAVADCNLRILDRETNLNCNRQSLSEILFTYHHICSPLRSKPQTSCNYPSIETLIPRARHPRITAHTTFGFRNSVNAVHKLRHFRFSNLQQSFPCLDKQLYTTFQLEMCPSDQVHCIVDHHTVALARFPPAYTFPHSTS